VGKSTREVRTIGDPRRTTRMKRRGLWAACVVLLVGVVGVLAVGAVSAKDENAGAKCSEATLDGRYLFAFDGSITEGNDQVPFAVAGHQVFHGNGKANGVSSFSENGKITRKEPFSVTYTVKADCTGTATLDAIVVTHYDMFIAPDGSMFTFVQTDPGTVASGIELRGTAKRVGD
jgi:hypothetical protein